jgi:hydroxymethylpyrimidine pyrophosphatase-like HAD family hydrolase
MPGVIDKKSGNDSPDIDIQVSGYVELLRNGTPEGLTFDEEHHIFTVNGKVIPSVTTILKRMGMTPDYSFVDPWYAQRGTYIHKATELWENGTLDEDSVDPLISGYIEAYKAFRRDSPQIVVTGQEIRLWHPVYRYAGIIDMIIEGNRHYKLFLRENGTYKLVEIEQIRSHLNVFISALNVVRWREQNIKEASNG